MGSHGSGLRLRGRGGQAAGLAQGVAGALGERVAEWVAHFFGEGFESLDDDGMLGGDVRLFADVVVEIVEGGHFALVRELIDPKRQIWINIYSSTLGGIEFLRELH